MQYFKVNYLDDSNFVKISRKDFYSFFDSFGYDCILRPDGGFNIYHTHTTILVAFCCPE